MTASQLQDNVISELRLDPRVDATQIGVSATDTGTVTLTGTVQSLAEKTAAETVAKEVYGVRGVANELTIELGATVRSDTEVSDAALRTLQVRSIPFENVKVTVQDGWVTLTGEVDYFYQKREAERAVEQLAGVTGVTNDLTIRPATQPYTEAKAKEEIEESLVRRARTDARNIDVTVENSRAVLQGSVESWAEFDEAESAAWRVPGILEVDNRLTVLP